MSLTSPLWLWGWGGGLTLELLSQSTCRPTAAQNPLLIPWKHILDCPRLLESLDGCRIHPSDHQVPAFPVPSKGNFHSGAAELKASEGTLQRAELANSLLFQVTNSKDFLIQI